MSGSSGGKNRNKVIFLRFSLRDCPRHQRIGQLTGRLSFILEKSSAKFLGVFKIARCNFLGKPTERSLVDFDIHCCCLKVRGGSAGVIESFYGVVKPIPIV